MYVFFKVCDKVMGLRPSARDEIQGLDMPEMGIKGYEVATIKGVE
jgi:Amt family ammonium transporter